MGYLAELEAELTVEATLLGINGVGSESENAAATAEHDLPWLQDTADEDVWGSWDVRYRDVIVVDADLYPVSTYNLTSFSLSDPDHVDALRALIEEAAD